jgi:hypothetical protein
MSVVMSKTHTKLLSARTQPRQTPEIQSVRSPPDRRAKPATDVSLAELLGAIVLHMEQHGLGDKDLHQIIAAGPKFDPVDIAELVKWLGELGVAMKSQQRRAQQRKPRK